MNAKQQTMTTHESIPFSNLVSISELGNLIINVGAVTTYVTERLKAQGLNDAYLAAPSYVENLMAYQIVLSVNDLVQKNVPMNLDRGRFEVVVLDVTGLEGIQFDWSIWALMLTANTDKADDPAHALFGNKPGIIVHADSECNPMMNALRTVSYLHQMYIPVWTPIAGSDVKGLSYIGSIEYISKSNRSTLESINSALTRFPRSTPDVDWAKSFRCQDLNIDMGIAGLSAMLKSMTRKYPHLLRNITHDFKSPNRTSVSRVFHYALSQG